MKKLKIKFEGLDDWSRPVFKQIDGVHRFGSTEKLLTLEEVKEGKLSEITENDLCYFGSSFNCEPLGREASNLVEIVKD